MEPIEILCEGTHLNFVKRGRWEFVTRTKAHGGVVIVAITDEEKVVLVEQFRPPAGGNVIELPAGLAGDEGDNESLLTAAKRELEEETGYTASRWTRLFSGLSSAGLSDETLTLFLAEDLSRTAAGGGVAGETITVHEVAIGCLTDWLDDKRREGKLLDLKLLGGLWAVQNIRKPPE